MVGALVGDPGEECELLELVWGITSLDRVEVARIAARDARGKLLEHRSSETFVKTTTEVGDLQGCHMRHDGGFLKVFNIQYAVDVDGRLVVALLECEDEDGNVRIVDNMLGFACCALGNAYPCVAGSCEPPAFCSGYISCPCASSGSCGVYQILRCRGGCPGPPTCGIGTCSNSVFNCCCGCL